MDLAKKYLQATPIGISVYLEKRKTRLYVGELRYDEKNKEFEFIYDLKYLYSRRILPLGPELPLRKKPFRSKTLFESFSDRIPSRENPAYPEYCQATGIDPEEKNPIVLLATIGRRGPSSFIFEPIYEAGIGSDEVIQFRNELDLTMREFASCFSLSPKSLVNIESGKSSGRDILKRLEIYIKFPEVALFEFRRNCGSIHLKKRRFAERILLNKIKPIK